MTADEIRARWAGIDLDSLWDWDHKDLRKQVEHGVVDIDYLLKENRRLMIALRFYADKDSYAPVYSTTGEYLLDAVKRDGGERARKVLDAIQTQSGRNSDAIAAEKE